MNLTHRTRYQALVSLSSTELGLIEQALARLDSPDAQQCLASLRSQTETRTVSDDAEFVDAWADGASVQVRAITVHADPVDMGTEEARDFARRILSAADIADG
ncbi:MAG TPA: hypothetical protein VG937_31125 [Polyangiaceae bacterium]|nr:hypothetical protein [Polyangiaceae bacterium]